MMNYTLCHADSSEISLDDADHIITDPPYELDMDELLEDLSRRCSGTIILFSYLGQEPRAASEYQLWIKTPSTKNFSRKCGNFVECISILKRPDSPYNGADLHWSNLTGLHHDVLLYKTQHPHQKPVALMRRLVHLYTNPGDTVADPFMGSGTTGVAALSLGRNFIGCEIDADRYALASQRIKDAVRFEGSPEQLSHPCAE